VSFLSSDAIEVDALRTDRYLDSLLAGSDRPSATDADPAVAALADRLDRELVRIHPSFRFEERLARRLAEIAAALRLPAAAGAEGGVIAPLPFPIDRATDPASDAFDPDDPGPLPTVPRPVIIGGAVASAALSIAGAAIVAWRLGRNGPVDPMARAVRAAHELRIGRPADADR
jgi:hypothetical protein